MCRVSAGVNDVPRLETLNDGGRRAAPSFGFYINTGYARWCRVPRAGRRQGTLDAGTATVYAGGEDATEGARACRLRAECAVLSPHTYSSKTYLSRYFLPGGTFLL